MKTRNKTTENIIVIVALLILMITTSLLLGDIRLVPIFIIIFLVGLAMFMAFGLVGLAIILLKRKFEHKINDKINIFVQKLLAKRR